jgi:tripartite-type tricarboxylate transporter receptor subunit TctC
MRRRQLLGRIAGVAVGSAAVAAGPSHAADAAYPNRPIRLVVPFPPGGSADVLARLMGERITAALGQPVVIDNRPGAGGILGADAVAKAVPDGHTLLFANTNIAINPSLYKQLPYDTVKAFEPVVLMVYVPNLLLVNPALPVRDVAELVALAKARPGALNYASAGNGTFPHLAMELFRLNAGVQMTHVPYKGAAPALNALLAGDVQVLSNDLLNGLPQVRAGKARALAITSTTRFPALPEVPTMVEAGLKNYSALAWQGLMAPAGTPKEVVARLNAVVNAALSDGVVRGNLTSQGLQVAGGTPQAFGEFIAQQTERWRAAVTASGATVD